MAMKGCSRMAVSLLVMTFAMCLPTLRAQTAETPTDRFKFSDVDNKLLTEVNEYDRQLEKKGLVFHDPEVDSFVEQTGRKVIAGQPSLENVEFRFRVVRDPMVNAFALPNGSVYVTTGLLSVLENEAQLASVLGHESTHVIERHTYLENRSVRKKTVALNILAGVAASMPVGSVYGAAIALGANASAAIVEGTLFGYSQDKEREADQGGFEMMTRASYDPRAMARTFELLDEKLEFKPVESFYQTHPKLEERRKVALERAASANVKDARVGAESEYLAHVAPAICANIEADLESRRERTAVSRALRLTKWTPDEPKYKVLLGDGYRGLGAKTAEPTLEEQGRQGQAEHRKEYFQMTEEEEQKQLLKKRDGAATQNSNFGEAEKQYLEAITLDSKYPEAHRGLGFLYEQESKSVEAAREYRAYLAVSADTTLDHLRIERRLAQVEKSRPRTAAQEQ
jgi:predicted Zn-dependent protease